MNSHQTNKLRLVLVLATICVGCAQMDHGSMMGNSSSTTPSLTGPCFTNPALPECATFMYPRSSAYADLDNLCTAMPFMSGCTVYFRCNMTGQALTSSNNATCGPFQLLMNICKHDTGMSRMAGCKAYNALCTNTSVIPQCLTHAGLPWVPPTRTVNAEAKSVCEEMPDMEGCSLCQADWAANKTFCMDQLLLVYSALCFSMPSHSQCAEYKTMCAGDPSLYLCASSVMTALRAPAVPTGFLPSSPAHTMSPAPASGPSPATNLSSCVQSPANMACASYVYPDELAQADLTSLCTAMPFMSACSLKTKCTGSTAATGVPTGCSAFDLVATICKWDTGMSMMKGCTNYNTLCASGSMVSLCSSRPGYSFLPTTSQANDKAKSICTEMTMDGCEQCSSDWAAGKMYASCDLLTVYSMMCYQMPEMTQCDTWASMCSAQPGLSLCGSTSGTSGSFGGPVMKMYFNQDLPFYLLFKKWTPEDKNQLTGAWFAIFFLAMAFEVLQVARSHFLAWVNRRLGEGACGSGCAQRAADYALAAVAAHQEDAGAKGCPCNTDLESTGSDPSPALSKAQAAVAPGACDTSSKGCCGVASNTAATEPVGTAVQPPLAQSYRIVLNVTKDVGSAIFTFVNMGVSYLLMLAAMSFNVAIFFAVITGLAVGAAVFTRWHARGITRQNDCCHPV